MKNILLLSMFIGLAYCYHPKLVLYEAGLTGSKPVRPLRSSDTICPKDFDSGFSIRCVSFARHGKAKFSIDGFLIGEESHPPFFIAGQKNGNPLPWINYPKIGARFKFSCITTFGTTSSFLQIICPTSENPQQPAGCQYKMKNSFDPIGSLYFKQANAVRTKNILLQSGMTFCPSDVYSSDDISILCKAPTEAMSGKFLINGRIVRYEPHQPFYIAGDKHGVPIAWNYQRGKSMTIRCVLGDGTETAAVENVKIGCPSKCSKGGTDNNPKPGTSAPPLVTPTPTSTPTSQSPCVIIDAKSSPLSFDWELLSDGVGYRVDKSTMNVTAAGETPLYYLFQVPQKGNYAIVLDMTTGNDVYFNDVWVNLQSGLNLINEGSTQSVSDWIPVFHNANGRAVSSFALDDFLRRSSVSTVKELVPRVNYNLGISGRSNQVIVHRILLFPCNGLECQYKYWKNAQNSCIPGSYV